MIGWFEQIDSLQYTKLHVAVWQVMDTCNTASQTLGVWITAPLAQLHSLVA